MDVDNDNTRTVIHQPTPIEKLSRDLGSTIVSALEDPKTIEVLLNADGGIWQEKLGEKMKCIGTMLPQRAAAVIQVVARYHGKTRYPINAFD